MINTIKIGCVVEWENKSGETTRSAVFAKYLEASAHACAMETAPGGSTWWAIKDVYKTDDGQLLVTGKAESDDCNEVKCPHCGEMQTDLWDHGMEDEQVIDVDCGSCEKPIRLSCSVTTTYEAVALVPLVKPPCARCASSGQIANTPAGEPWPQWEELPAASKMAVTAGIVRPVPCPSCCGGVK